MKTFAQWEEEWKPFPHDKVAKQIAKKKARNTNTKDKAQAGIMKGVAKVMATRDAHKTVQPMAGKDGDKFMDKEDKLQNKAVKAMVKSFKAAAEHEKKGGQKRFEKADKAYEKGGDAKEKANEKTGERIAIVRNRNKYVPRTDEEGNKRKDYRGGMKDSKSDLERQAEHNRKTDEEDKRLASSLDKKKAEGALKAKPKRARMKGPKIKNTIKKESLDFTEFCDSLAAPLYEKEGDIPKCPPGYKYDPKLVMCVPKTQKDAVGPSKYGNKDLKPGNSPGYNAIGNSGYSGAGYAFEEPPTPQDLNTK